MRILISGVTAGKFVLLLTPNLLLIELKCVKEVGTLVRRITVCKFLTTQTIISGNVSISPALWIYLPMVWKVLDIRK